MSKKNIIQESIQDVTVSIQDEIASKAVRKSTLKSIKEKKKSRLKQLKIDYEKAVQDVHLQYAENPERLKAECAAAE
jgi:hemolysin III